MSKKKASVATTLRRLTRSYNEFMEIWRRALASDPGWITQLDAIRRFDTADLHQGLVGFGSDDLAARIAYGTVGPDSDQNWSLFTGFVQSGETARYRYWLANSWSSRPGLALTDTQTDTSIFVQADWDAGVATLRPVRLNDQDIVRIDKKGAHLHGELGDAAVSSAELVMMLEMINAGVEISKELVYLIREMVAEAA